MRQTKRRKEMNVTHVVFDPNTFGITNRSLKMLRNALAEKINHRIVVVEVQTNDLCCGYFIFDWEWQNATWTGDGFRTDRGGEGGAGYRSAEVLFRIFGISDYLWGVEADFDKIYILPEEQIENELKKIAQKIAETLDDEAFKRCSEKIPRYVR